MAAKLSGGGGGDRYVIEQNAEINVTPFVDIMLVLLIIFMVSLPQPTASIKLDLPPPDPNANPNQNQKKPEYISIASDGKLYLSGNIVRATSKETLPADLAAALNTTYPENTGHPQQNMVLIRADQDVEYEKFMDVLNILEENGYLKIGLISEYAD